MQEVSTITIIVKLDNFWCPYNITTFITHVLHAHIWKQYRAYKSFRPMWTFSGFLITQILILVNLSIFAGFFYYYFTMIEMYKFLDILWYKRTSKNNQEKFIIKTPYKNNGSWDELAFAMHYVSWLILSIQQFYQFRDDCNEHKRLSKCIYLFIYLSIINGYTSHTIQNIYFRFGQSILSSQH